jgi:hypothetical protein
VPPRLRRIICIHAIWNLYDRWEGTPGSGVSETRSEKKGVGSESA